MVFDVQTLLKRLSFIFMFVFYVYVRTVHTDELLFIIPTYAQNKQ